MAYVDGKWLMYEERGQYLSDLKSELSLLSRLLNTDKIFESDIARMEFLIEEIDRVDNIHKGEYDVLHFALSYFSEDENPLNEDNLIPKGINVNNSAKFHKELCEMLNDVTKGKVDKHVAWSCFRGSAKTAYLSNIFLTHQIVYQKRKFIVLVSETTDVAGDFISWSKNQLKFNEKLRRDFGELMHEKPTMNALDNRNEFLTKSNIKVVAKGLQVQMRGLRHGSTRPDMIIIDDAESRDSTNTPELINKSKAWFREDMIPALSEHGIVIYLGTILCYDSLLDYVIRERRDFTSKMYPAITKWADADDLWAEWRDIYRKDSPDASDNAYEFFMRNEEEMLKGSEVLWENRYSYYDLMVLRENNGAKAFAQEFQNTPTDEERQLFKPEYFHYFTDDDIKHMNLEYYCGVDSALGKEKGDYTVIVTIAKNVDTGVCYVVDSFMQRVHPDVMIKEVVNNTIYYQYEMLGVEAVFAQEYLADKIIEELNKVGYPGHTRVRKIKHRTRKQLRIEMLLPEIQSGRLRFHEKFRDSEEMAQFEMYGMTHDDFPDGLAMAYSTADNGTSFIRTTRKRMR